MKLLYWSPSFDRAWTFIWFQLFVVNQFEAHNETSLLDYICATFPLIHYWEVLFHFLFKPCLLDWQIQSNCDCTTYIMVISFKYFLFDVHNLRYLAYRCVDYIYNVCIMYVCMYNHVLFSPLEEKQLTYIKCTWIQWHIHIEAWFEDVV